MTEYTHGTIYRHVKRGTRYRVLHTGALWEPTMEAVVVYQDIDSNKIWVRPQHEFFDGRFAREPGL